MLAGSNDSSEVVKFWLGSASEDWEFAVEIQKSGRRLYNALFFAQLALEKTLKALHYYKKDDHPLLTHDLVLLSKKLDLDLDKEMLGDLREISSFNITARYDDYKHTFRRRATPEFVGKWMSQTKEIRNYILRLLEDKA